MFLVHFCVSFSVLGFVSSVLDKRLVRKSISKIIFFVPGRTLNFNSVSHVLLSAVQWLFCVCRRRRRLE